MTKNINLARQRVAAAKGLLFDMNNTVVFMDNIDFAVFYHPLKDTYGIEITYPDFLKHTGKRCAEVFKELVREHTNQIPDNVQVKKLCQEAWQLKRHLLSDPKSIKRVRLAPGIVTFLTWAKKQGKHLAIVTSTAKKYVPTILEAVGLKEFFDVIVTADDVIHGKPHPEPFLTGLEWLGLTPGQAVAFEDSVAGAKSAKAAGLFVVGFLTPGQNNSIIDSADAVITDYRQLLGDWPPEAESSYRHAI